MLPIKDENPHPPGFRPTVTISLMIANGIMFVYSIMFTGQFLDFTNIRAAQMFFELGAVPACITGSGSFEFNGLQVECVSEPYVSLITSIFMHGGLIHLGGNMLFLWIFGDNIELKFGKLKFLGIYIVWGILAGLAHVAVDTSSPIPAVGASGAISGILGAYLVLFPRTRILTFIGLGIFWHMIHIQARWFLPFWFIFQNILPFLIDNIGFGIAGGGVAYMAHIGGFIVGIATGYAYKKLRGPEFTYGTRYGWRGDYRSRFDV